ncbi:class II fructose-bisphosphate aldolase [Nitrospina watsonii]|uniref:Fructose 1,6-biphosphate aldolase n=1 Tax=Nitrospina watsonii TaxID=1323948 RepID=A0ABM9HE12_9BACT|nr:class II fructose-bisphosphate aldolase [Nitrospina watsonii]CAI2718443.1 putative fructose 1,6-biphosphate aldolase [Nitrospina watsonii]
MLFSTKQDLIDHLKGAASCNNSDVHLENEDALRDKALDRLVHNAVLNPTAEIRGRSRFAIKSLAAQQGIVPASIQDLYEARGQGKNKGYTVPAINIRGMTYETCRAIFRTAQACRAGAFIFEIAKSEIGYTHQRPHEYAAVVLAAAIKEKYRGPVFIQGDHFQVNAQKFHENRDKEIEGLKDLIRDALLAGFYNIDIDTSTLVTLEPEDVKEQQRLNFEVGVELTQFIRELEPEGVTVSVGGEIGEVGKENSNEKELRAYMDNFNERLAAVNPQYKTISKISIQTGTEHGGVPLADGSVADVQLDFETLEKLSQISREQYHLAGAVQHGASTLPAEMFHKFPELETAEIHLATNFQNMIYDSTHFPQTLKQEIYDYLRKQFADEKKANWTDEQFIYKTRKKGFGNPFKERFWNLPDDIKAKIGKELEDKFHFLFEQLKANDTRQYVDATVQSVTVAPDLQNELEHA